ncbi:hypothetical protein JCM3774_001250 [Rhodotorula dairenensis]
MATAPAPAAGEAPPAQPKKGLWDSLSPSEQKKAVTVFLCSLGVTLLITGRSGGKLLKRAKATEQTTTTASKAVEPAIVVKPRPAPTPAPAPAVTPTTSTNAPSTTTPRQRPQAPPVSFLHPNELTPLSRRSQRRRRGLLASFVLPSSSSSAAASGAPVSVLPSSSRPPAPSSYFLPNPTIVAASNAFADEVDRYDKLHEDGEDVPPPPPSSEDDGFNPAVFAMKALGIATLLSVGTFAAGIYGVMRYLGVQDVESLALALQHRLPSIFDAHRPSIPEWATPSSSTTASPEANVEQVADSAEEEEMSYWDSIKETLDREAEENRRERRAAWEERVRQRALALAGEGGERRQV